MAAPPVFNGDVVTKTMPTFNVLAYGAKADGSTDNTTAINNAISAASSVGGGTIYFPCALSSYVVLGALTVPYTGTDPVQAPIRLTGCGPAWNGNLSGDITPTGSVLDLRYTGGDGLHPAKIDLRGRGHFEIDHLTLEDTGGDNFKFGSTTNTTVYAHDNVYIGNIANSGTSVTQDAWQLGGDGYWSATGVSTTNGSPTLTCSDCNFTSSMVGWTIYYSAAGAIDSGSASVYGATISAFNSSTSVTLNANATATISGGEANFFGTGTSDAQAPYQGYTSRFVHNLYNHICHAADLGNYANGIVFADELFAFTSGCSGPNGAWYQFDKASSLRLADIFRAPQGEIQNYAHVVYAYNDAQQNVFENLAPDDANATFTSAVYLGGGASYNTVSIGAVTAYAFGTANTTIAGSFSSGAQTVTPASMSGISTGTKLLVDPDTTPEWVTVSSTTTTTFTATFANAHGAGVRVLGTVPAVAGTSASYALTTVLGDGRNADGITLPNQVFLGSTTQGYPVTVNTNLTLPHAGTSLSGNAAINDGGTVAGNLSYSWDIALGTLGTSTHALAFGNGSGSTTANGATLVSGGGDSLSGTTLNCFEVGQSAVAALFGATCGSSSAFYTKGSIVPGSMLWQTASCKWSCKVTLAAGTVTWNFSPAFSSAPVCTATPEGAPSGSAIVYIQTLTASGIIVTSTNAADTRVVDVICIGNPN